MSSPLTQSQLSDLRRKNARRWEANIRRQCAHLKTRGRAFVDKNWEAPLIPGTNRPRETSKPDFSGHTDTGRHVVFEAKSQLFEETRFDFSQISEGQREQLENAYEAGAISFVFLLDGYGVTIRSTASADSMRRKWVIPFSEILRQENIEGNASFPYPGARHCSDDAYIEHFKKRRGETWLDCWNRLESGGLT